MNPKFAKFATVTALSAASLFATQAHAIGAGFNFARYNGDAEVDSLNRDADVDHSEYGFVLDTSRRHHRFAYRLNLNVFDGELDGVDYEGWAINNTFAIPLTRGGPVRFWLGPTLSINGIDYDGISRDELALGFGISAGLDIYASDAVAIGFELGARRIEYDADRDDGIPFNQDREYETNEVMGRIVMLFGKF